MKRYPNNFTDKQPVNVPRDAIFHDSDTYLFYKWDGKKFRRARG